MRAQSNRPPPGQPWVWLTRDLLTSPAWRALGINARRLIDYLLIEHMGHGGTRNGFLLAPWRELELFGIGARHISAAIKEVQRLGLVRCRHGVGRQPNHYSLTWLPLSDGSAPSNEWQAVCLPKGRHATARREGTKPIMPSEGKTLGPKSVPPEGKALLRSSIQGGAVISVLSEEGYVAGNGHLPGKGPEELWQ
jgi:hypothetical protein